MRQIEEAIGSGETDNRLLGRGLAMVAQAIYEASHGHQVKPGTVCTDTGCLRRMEPEVEAELIAERDRLDRHIAGRPCLYPVDPHGPFRSSADCKCESCAAKRRVREREQIQEREERDK